MFQKLGLALLLLGSAAFALPATANAQQVTVVPLGSVANSNANTGLPLPVISHNGSTSSGMTPIQVTAHPIFIPLPLGHTIPVYPVNHLPVTLPVPGTPRGTTPPATIPVKPTSGSPAGTNVPSVPVPGNGGIAGSVNNVATQVSGTGNLMHDLGQVGSDLLTAFKNSIFGAIAQAIEHAITWAVHGVEHLFGLDKNKTTAPAQVTVPLQTPATTGGDAANPTVNMPLGDDGSGDSGP